MELSPPLQVFSSKIIIILQKNSSRGSSRTYRLTWHKLNTIASRTRYTDYMEKKIKLMGRGLGISRQCALRLHEWFASGRTGDGKLTALPRTTITIVLTFRVLNTGAGLKRSYVQAYA